MVIDMNNQLPTRCIDPVSKDCQGCRWGIVVYLSNVETYEDTIGVCFNTSCYLGFDRGRPEDEPTEEACRRLKKEAFEED